MTFQYLHSVYVLLAARGRFIRLKTYSSSFSGIIVLYRVSHLSKRLVYLIRDTIASRELHGHGNFKMV